MAVAAPVVGSDPEPRPVPATTLARVKRGHCAAFGLTICGLSLTHRLVVDLGRSSVVMVMSPFGGSWLTSNTVDM